MSADPPFEPEPDALLAATILLMSAYAREGGGPRLAGAVLRHLELLADRADLPGVLTATCDHAADLWVGLSRMPTPQATGAAPRRPPAAASGMRALLRLVTERGPAPPAVSP
ncbi:MAG: hypothetical protein EHM87_16975 [Burkholderiales bacterium]|nr:MAG: hypothetical protein EHM87_16975 [Burkholderiales bacterium]